MDRLDLLASLCKDSNTICDIGCDHAYVIIKALKEYNVLNAIAADVADGPLNSAKKNLIDANLIDRVDIIKSNGFIDINASFDTAVIAGMGGILIKKILEDSIDKIKNKKLILQPNSDRYLVRKYLSENGFVISDEYSIIDSDKYYEIIVAIPGNIKYDELDLNYGPILLKKKDITFINHYNRIKNELASIINKVKDTKIKEEKQILYNEIIKVIGE